MNEGNKPQDNELVRLVSGKLVEFAELVGQMRAAQRLYFRTRDLNVLERSKDLERQVDAELKRMADTQARLF